MSGSDFKEMLHGSEFQEVLINAVCISFKKPDFQEMLTNAVADAVCRANEATLARMDSLEEELVATRARLAEAEQRLDDVENQRRRNCVVISGVPETTGESTDELVVDVGRAAGLELSPDSLDATHRLGKPQPGKARPILARFVRNSMRQQLNDRRKELSADKVRGHTTLTRPVLSKTYIAESLSPKSQQLLYVARQLRKKNALWAAYTTNGRVKVKKTETDAARNINNMTDLESIVGGSVLRDFRPPATSRTTRARQEAGPSDPTWRAAGALDSWVTERRRRGMSPASAGAKGGRGERR